VFKINRPIRTIHNELVIPILVEGRLVHVLDMNKHQKILDLADFDFEPKKKTSRKQTLVIVKPSDGPIDENSLFEPNSGGYLGGIYEEKPLVVQPATSIPTPTPTPEINTTPIEIKVDDTIPQNTPTILPDGKPQFIVANRILRIRMSGKAVRSFEPKLDTKLANDFYGGF
jgi:hypothetical protein